MVGTDRAFYLGIPGIQYGGATPRAVEVYRPTIGDFLKSGYPPGSAHIATPSVSAWMTIFLLKRCLRSAFGKCSPQPLVVGPRFSKYEHPLVVVKFSFLSQVLSQV